MITPDEEKAVLARAYVPEHSVELMTRISGGEPFLFEDYFCCRTRYGVIVVGYPLQDEFDVVRFEKTLGRIAKAFRPSSLSIIAPQAPPSYQAAFVERKTDVYYTLNLPAKPPGGTLGRMVRKAAELAMVEQAMVLTQDHRDLAREFTERIGPPPRITELLGGMWRYVGYAGDCMVLNARHGDGRLAAFFVVDCAPKEFASYIIGCHSKKDYLPGASDLLMSRLIAYGSDLGKRYIHLGIGVNRGIRQFKEKWGGIPATPYELCEIALRKPSLLDALLGYAVRP
ncbi:MAG: GNAT family N-acetyltransferase, partial [Pseudomonadota bacterium]